MESQTELRNQSFVKEAMLLLGAAMAKGERLTRRQLIERTLCRRPPHFFVNFEHALHVVGAILANRGGQPRSAKACLWYDLASQVLQTQRRRPELSVVQALTYVLCYRRPLRYHLSYNTARHILAAAVKNISYIEPIKTANK